MTLPLRKKLQTTVPSIRSQVKARSFPGSTFLVRKRRALQRGLWLGLLIVTSHTSLQAQTPGWQPNRLPNSSSMQPLTSAGQASSSAQAPSPTVANDQNNSGVVLRWRTGNQNNRPTASSAAANMQASTPTAAQAQATSSASLASRALESNSVRPATAQSRSVATESYAAPASHNSATNSNPLRSTSQEANLRPSTSAPATFVPRGTSIVQRSSVQPANFQAPGANVPQLGQGNAADGGIAPPNFPPINNGGQLQVPPALDVAPNFPQPPGQDALNLPEAAPAPPWLRLNKMRFHHRD